MRFQNIWAAEKRVNELEAAYINKPLFAIRKKNSSFFLPRPPSGQKGGSWVEPISVTAGQPRFFPTLGAAKSFLTQWLKGPVIVSWSTDWETGYEEHTLEHRPEKARDLRKADDYEIVEIFWGVKG